jgi:hypothetical protein
LLPWEQQAVWGRVNCNTAVGQQRRDSLSSGNLRMVRAP